MEKDSSTRSNLLREVLHAFGVHRGASPALDSLLAKIEAAVPPPFAAEDIVINDQVGVDV